MICIPPRDTSPHRDSAGTVPAAHRRRHSRPHHHRHGEHSLTARQPHSNGPCSLPKEGPGPGSAPCRPISGKVQNKDHTHTLASPLTKSTHRSAFTRYSFSSRPLYKIQYYYSQTLPSFGHPTRPRHRPRDCAIQCFPPTILYCNTCPTILATAISCKGQPTAPFRVQRRGCRHRRGK